MHPTMGFEEIVGDDGRGGCFNTSSFSIIVVMTIAIAGDHGGGYVDKVVVHIGGTECVAEGGDGGLGCSVVGVVVIVVVVFGVVLNGGDGMVWCQIVLE